MTRWTSTLFRCKVAIILRMFHVLHFMTVFWWLRWCVTLLLMYTSYGLNAVCFGSLSWKIVPIFLKRRKGGMLQIGPNLSSGIRWCLALASVRQLWCLLWHVWCVCMCVCRVNGGPDLVCVMEACLICVICVNRGIWNLGIYQLLRIGGACNVCPSCVLWLNLSPAWVMSVSKWGC